MRRVFKLSAQKQIGQSLVNSDFGTVNSCITWRATKLTISSHAPPHVAEVFGTIRQEGIVPTSLTAAELIVWQGFHTSLYLVFIESGTKLLAALARIVNCSTAVHRCSAEAIW